MPILVPSADVPPPIPQPVPALGPRSVITWTTPGGYEIPLTGDISGSNAGIIVTQGIKGFDAPTIELTLDEMPSLDGAAFRSLRSPTRELFIPLFLWAPTRSELLALKRSLLSAMNPKKGPGVLRVDEPADNSSRHISCYYVGGLEGDEQDGAGFTWTTYGLTLHAPDPFWYGDAQDVTFDMSPALPINFYTGKTRGAYDESTGPFIIPGIHLSSTYVPPGGRVLTVEGDVESWPVWTITGTNATQFTLNNLTTGKSLSLLHSFGLSGDVVTIDTRPGYKTVTSTQHGNVYFELAPAPDLWSLQEGENTIEIKLTGPTNTSVTGWVDLSYQPRYLGA